MQTNPIRIAFLIHTLEGGGAEGQLVEWLRALPSGEFQCRVSCLVKGGFHEAAVREMGIPIDLLGYSPMRRADGTLDWAAAASALPALWRLVRQLRRFRPQIVQTFLQMSDVMGAMAVRLAGRDRIRLIGSRRSLSDIVRLTGARGRVLRWAVRSADTIVCNSHAVAEDVVRHQGAAPERIVTIYNGVDVRRFESARSRRETTRAALGLSPATTAIGCVAQLRPEKDHESLFHAFADLRRGGRALSLILVGSGPRETALRDLAHQLSLGDAVRFLGVRKDVPDLMAAFDILVLPSRSEGFSNVVLEGMASGLPIVAAHVGGNPEALDDGRCGVLVEPCSREALREGMGKLLDNPPEAHELADRARRRAREVFSIERLHENVRAFYRQVAGTTTS